jgi:Tfp pilus assembly protein PilP
MTIIVRSIIAGVALPVVFALSVNGQTRKPAAQAPRPAGQAPKPAAQAQRAATPAPRPQATRPPSPVQRPAPQPKKTVPPASPAPAVPAPPAASDAPETSTAEAAPSTPAAPAAETPTAVEPQGYTYDPQGRRDPFVSLLRRGSDVPRTGGPGARPNGLAGLETSEVTLKGTLASQGTYVGILQGSDQKTYIVKAGDRLLDGTIRAIAPDSMVITQQVTDPLSLDKQREVRKLLRQTEEAK